MKIVNEKGKLFGLINLVDFLVVLAVILVVGGVAYKLLSTQITEAVSPTQEITFHTRVRAIYPRLIPEIEKEKGAQLISGNDYVKDAYIEDVYFEPYVQQVPTADGRLVNAEDPVRVDAVFIVKARVPKNTAVMKVGTQEIRGGNYGHFLKTRTIEFSTNIEKVILGD